MEKLEVDYEWCIEELDEHKDIIEVWFSDDLNYDDDMLSKGDLVLRRITGNEAQGIVTMLYAYVENETLPEKFGDSDIKVPKKYHNELKMFYNRIKA